MRKIVNQQGVNLCFAYFMTYAAGAAWFPLFTLFLQKSGLSGTESGITVSLIFVAMFVALPFWGLGADRWSRKKALIAAIISSSFSLLFYLLGNGFLFFFFWTLFFAVVFNPIPPLLDSLALDYTEDSKSVSFGHLRMFGSLGWLVAAPIVGYFIQENNIRLIFPVAALLYASNILFIWRMPERRKDPAAIKLSWVNLRHILGESRMIVFLLIILLVSVVSFCIQTFLAVYLDDMNASPQLIGWAFSIEGMSEIPFYFISAWLIRKAGLRKVFLFTLIVTAVRMFLYSVIHDPHDVLILELTHGISYALFFVTMVETANSLIPSAWRATGQSLIWASYNGLGALIGNALAGFLIDVYSVHRMFFINAVLLSVIVVFALIFFVTGKRNKVERVSCN